MLPTNNINCCSVCDCISKVTRPMDNIKRRNRRIDRIIENDPERAAEMTRYGWTGVISAIFAIALQVVMFFLTYKFVSDAILKMVEASGWEAVKQNIASGIANLVVSGVAIVTFICAIVAGISGCASAIVYGRHQKRLNDKAIGSAAVITGLACLAVMIIGIVVVLFAVNNII